MSENDAKTAERSDKLVRTLVTMFDYLGLNGSFKVEERGTKLAVKISSNDAGRVIGRKGQTLESLQLLVNRMMFKQDEEFPHVMLDIDGYACGDRAPREHDGAESEGGERPVRERSEHRRFPRGGEEDHMSVEQLEQSARDAAKEVKRWGEPVRMAEMNAHDRRIIHMTLRDDPEVVTESEGEGAMKKVVVSLRKEETENR